MFRKSLVGIPVAAALAASPLPAAAETFTIDPVHSNIVFRVSHLGYSDMIGQFQEFEGSFTHEQGDLSAGSVDVTIHTASVDTDHEDRDEHLRSPDFFNIREFPRMRFTSTRIEATGERSGRISGELTMLGVTRPVTFEFTVNKVAPHPLPQYDGVLTAGISARGTIRRSEFGMTNFVPGIGDEVELRLEMEGQAG